MGTKTVVSTAKSRIKGAVPVAPTAAELAFFRRPETRAWWDASAARGQQLADKGFWADRKNGLDLVPYGPLIPSYVETGGPDNQPIVKGLSSGLPPDALITPSGNIALVVGNLCVWAVAKSGIGNASPLFSLAGNNGGGVSVRLRNGDLAMVTTEVDELVYQTRISQALSSSTYHLVQFNYKHSASVMNLSSNGAKLVGGTPSSGDFTYTHGFPSNRMSWFGEYDQTDGISGNPPRELSVAMCGVATTYAPENAAWQAALVAMVAERFPSLGLT